MAPKAGSRAASRARSKSASQSGSRKKSKAVSKSTTRGRSKTGRRRTTDEASASPAPGDAYDFERLERAISTLVAEQGRLRSENAALWRKLTDRDRQVKNLNDELLELNRRRSDAMKRLDDLISQVDAFESKAFRAGG